MRDASVKRRALVATNHWEEPTMRCTDMLGVVHCWRCAADRGHHSEPTGAEKNDCYAERWHVVPAPVGRDAERRRQCFRFRSRRRFESSLVVPRALLATLAVRRFSNVMVRQRRARSAKLVRRGGGARRFRRGRRRLRPHTSSPTPHS